MKSFVLNMELTISSFISISEILCLLMKTHASFMELLGDFGSAGSLLDL